MVSAASGPQMAIVLRRGNDAPERLPSWARSVALSGSALAQAPGEVEILPLIDPDSDRGALSGLAWQIARLRNLGPLILETPLASAQATEDLLGLAQASGDGLLLGGAALALRPEMAAKKTVAVAPIYPERLPLSERLHRGAVHARRDGAVILVVEDSAAARADIESWLQSPEAGDIQPVAASQALAHLAPK